MIRKWIGQAIWWFLAPNTSHSILSFHRDIQWVFHKREIGQDEVEDIFHKLKFSNYAALPAPKAAPRKRRSRVRNAKN